ncbi:TRAP transporter small permease [Falsirhodobacter deserti]|uniref:TRAP transporter small permease n=1 Tax=Falsirhodobacter deserti TaxID=1365611 RepID=UPI000FE29E5D|nr:TRAP transporter small permease [Falsirhodobacter deserti]
MIRLRRLLDLCVGSVCAVLLAALVVVLCWQVISRYALNAPSTLTEETLRFGVIWLSLLGAAYATGRGTHMTIDLARNLATGRTRQLLEILVPVGFILFALAVLVIGGMRGVEIASRQVSPVLRIPMGWVYASLPVSGVLMILYSLLNLIDLLRGTRGRPDSFEKALSAVE